MKENQRKPTLEEQLLLSGLHNMLKAHIEEIKLKKEYKKLGREYKRTTTPAIQEVINYMKDHYTQ